MKFSIDRTQYPSVLYITRNGILEPLGQSQVLAYLRGLSRSFQITLVSFEKAADLADSVRVRWVQAECLAHGIVWLPQRFHYRPRLIAPVWSMVVLLWISVWATVRGHARMVHARAYIPTFVALVLARLCGTPFVFDMRALWPEELIGAGKLRRGSVLHRVIAWAERRCVDRASAVISLTHAAAAHLRETLPDEMAGKPLVVIPTCADLLRFVPATIRTTEVVYSCIGTVLSGWFLIDMLAACFADLARRDPSARFEILTRDDPDRVRMAVDYAQVLGDRLSVFAVQPEDMHLAVQGHYASVMFFTGGLSKLGSSPTRLGEVLGAGLPVVASNGVGDVAQIIERFNVGVVVADAGEGAMTAALDRLETLMRDPQLATRCREAAEQLFSLEAGTAALADVWTRSLKTDVVA